jgi:hypothetical protein
MNTLKSSVAKFVGSKQVKAVVTTTIEVAIVIVVLAVINVGVRELDATITNAIHHEAIAE